MDSTTLLARMWSGRFADFLYRRRYVLFAAWLLHTFLLHYYFLGFISWDGFGHRGFPIVELVQHGSYGVDKFPTEWSLTGFTWFLENAHAPFLAAFGMKGFLIGFPLVVFPLCVAAVFAFLDELSGQHRVATFGALAYIAMPFINSQPFSAYVDFAVSACLAYWLYALLKLRARTLRPWDYARVVLATAIFTLTRVQALYVAVLIFPVLAYALWFERWKLADRRRLLVAIGLIAVGSLPSLYLQIQRYLELGSPTYPIQLSFLGLKLGSGGFTRDRFFELAGIGGDDWGHVLRGAWTGWVLHWDWPVGAWFSSRFMAAGLLVILAVVLLPFGVRSLGRLEWWLLAAFGGITLLTRDIGVPRYAYTVVLALVIVLGRELAALSESARWRPVYWGAIAVVLAHLARPELDAWWLRQRELIVPRLNAASSAHFIGLGEPMWPDVGAHLYVIHSAENGFLLPLYGKHLGNEILGEIPQITVGPHCEGLRPYAALAPDAMFVDDFHTMEGCARRCALHAGGVCRAWTLLP